MSDKKNELGSVWHRWDPHIHAPGTVLANNFGKTDWDAYLSAIEASEPRIRALGVTDYYSVSAYEQVCAHKLQGRLMEVDLIILNVEMRFGIGTERNHPVNFHLLVSPDDPEHVEQTTRFMRRLTFAAHGDTFACDRADLIRLGRAHLKNATTDEVSALAAGTNQFKVDPAKLREEYEKSEWARNNILVAVAASENDGTSGLQSDSSLATVRREIEKFAHVVFGSSAKLRSFWLGLGAATLQQLRDGWGGQKPCLHGSDAHDLAHVGKPTNSLYTWIKGDLTFEGLRQAVLEPSGRAFVGTVHPRGALPSEVMTKVAVGNAPWFTNGGIPLNSGLIAVIGARGSGKTALAELIAAGAFAAKQSVEGSERKSFLHRASKHLVSSRATVSWEAGSPTYNDLSSVEIEGLLDSPRVRYLSQQFVDVLCSSEGMTDELLAEIERVVFQAHPEEERMEASDFRELLTLRAERARNERTRQEAALAQVSVDLATERQRQDILPTLRKQRGEAFAVLEKDKTDRQALLGTSSTATDASAILNEVATVTAARRAEIQGVQRRRLSLLALGDEVRAQRIQTLPMMLQDLKETHADVGITDADWASFELAFRGDPEAVIAAAVAAADRKTAAMKGTPLPSLDVDGTPSSASALATGIALTEQDLSHLEAETTLLTRLVGIASANAKAYSRLSEKITAGEAALVKLDKQIAQGEASAAKIINLQKARLEHYEKTFGAIVAEELEMATLYEPLKAQIEGEPGALGKLTFNVRRIVDAEAWAKRGEALLDVRKAGPFRGKGALLAAVEEHLLEPWQSGSAADVATAMAGFRSKHDKDFVAQSLEDRSNMAKYRQWAASLSAWLYDANHIKIGYGIQYDSVEIEQLSPGTRGIVLLLLYLSLDRNDDRPLIIDQPEENLDPKSVFDELVGRFRDAKLRRQIIIVTHNANLVVNTDADQVIVAHAGSHQPGALPAINYLSGGLENPDIRRRVCEILEGGEAAFLERAKRLRLSL